jgi:hypothetical protein
MWSKDPRNHMFSWWQLPAYNHHTTKLGDEKGDKRSCILKFVTNWWLLLCISLFVYCSFWELRPHLPACSWSIDWPNNSQLPHNVNKNRKYRSMIRSCMNDFYFTDTAASLGCSRDKQATWLLEWMDWCVNEWTFPRDCKYASCWKH